MKNYQNLAMRTAKDLPTLNENLLHAAIGIGSEVGEFCFSRYTAIANNVPSDRENVVEELGDICWYAALFCRTVGKDFDTIGRTNSEHFGHLEDSTGARIDRFRSTEERIYVMAHYAGEFQTLVKKHTFYGKEILSDDVEKMALMVSQLRWVVASLGLVYGIGFEEILEANVAKLQKRYPGKFSNEDAIERKDKA